MDGCKEICQRQTEMEKADRPMFQQELEELRSKVSICTSYDCKLRMIKDGNSAFSPDWCVLNFCSTATRWQSRTM